MPRKKHQAHPHAQPEEFMDAEQLSNQVHLDLQSNGREYGIIGELSRTKLTIVSFLVALLLPTYTSFALGSLRLTTYRLFLLLAFMPCLTQLVSNAKIRPHPADGLVAASAFWAAITYVYHEGTDQGMQAGGVYILETLGAYLLGRVLVSDAKAFRGLVAFLTIAVCCLLFFSLPEALTGKNLFGQIPLDTGQRLGLDRARGCFDHPIILGVFCASVFSMSWCTFSSSVSRICTPMLALAAFTSVSSGAITALFVQWALLLWIRLTGRIQHKWRLLFAVFCVAYIVIDLFSNRTPMRVFVSYLTLSPGTAYARMLIWDWGFHENALKHPILGIGLSNWVRPSWLFSSSMDNFWLVLMVRHGIPCFAFLAMAIYFLLASGAKGARLQGVVSLHTGWAFSLVGMLVAGSTVHFWNALLVYFFFLLGAGAWFRKDSSMKN